MDFIFITKSTEGEKLSSGCGEVMILVIVRTVPILDKAADRVSNSISWFDRGILNDDSLGL